MNIITGFVKLKSTMFGLDESFTPQLELEAIRALRHLGFSYAEIKDGEIPDKIIEDGINLILNNPDEFNRQIKDAGQFFRALN